MGLCSWMPMTATGYRQIHHTDRKEIDCKDCRCSSMHLKESPDGAIVAGSVVDWGMEIEDSFALIVLLMVPARDPHRKAAEEGTCKIR
jgi:hypothetical protein